MQKRKTVLCWAIFYIIGTNVDFFRDNYQGFPGGSYGKEPICNTGDLSLILGLGRSPGGGHGTPILAWKIPWTEEPGGLQSIGSLRVGHD